MLINKMVISGSSVLMALGIVFGGCGVSYGATGVIPPGGKQEPLQGAIKVVPPADVEVNDEPGWKNDSVKINFSDQDLTKMSFGGTSIKEIGYYIQTVEAKPGYEFDIQKTEAAGYKFCNTDNTECDYTVAYQVFNLEHTPHKVTMKPPIIIDKDGWKEDNVIFPNGAEGVEYKGNYDKRSGKWVLVGKAKHGYTFAGGSMRLSGVLDVPSPSIAVEPQLPVIVDKPGYINDTVTAPKNTDAIVYDLSYDKKKGDWSMVAKVRNVDKYVFPDGLLVDTISGDLDVSSITVSDPTVPQVIQTGYVANEDAINALDTAPNGLIGNILWGLLAMFAGLLGGLVIGDVINKLFWLLVEKQVRKQVQRDAKSNDSI